MITNSKKLNTILEYAREEARRTFNQEIKPEHLFLGIVRDGDNKIINILVNQEIDVKRLKNSISAEMLRYRIDEESEPIFNEATMRVFNLMQLEAISLESDKIEIEHLFLALLRAGNNKLAIILNRLGYDYAYYVELLKKAPQNQAKPPHDDDDDDDDDEKQGPYKHSAGGRLSGIPRHLTGQSSDTPVLDNFGIDLTKAAQDGKLDPIVGREVEIERVIQILSRRKKNNPVLIGEPGVGKSAIVEGLALRIIKKDVSRVLFNKRIVSLDLASLVAGTKYRGQFEERMKQLLNELSRTDNVILFIDEIHTIVGAGGASGSLDASNMLKPALARGEIQTIGATTLDEYRQHIEKDGALERRFQKIIVEPTTPAETMEILKNIKDKYEDFHNVQYTDEAIEACVRLGNRYISDRYLPDKAIDILDEAGSRVHISKISVPENIEKLEQEIEKIKEKKVEAVKQQNYEVAASYRDKEQKLTDDLAIAKEEWMKALESKREIVDLRAIEEVVAMMTGVPVKRIAQGENQRLKNMRKSLKEQIIGQDEAVDKIVRSIQRNRTGLKDPNRPIGSFIFLGPTGVGKTYLAKLLSEFLFDSKDALIRIDMSEYMEKFSISRLVGAPPGYIGYEEGGQLTEKVRRKPYSVVLLDEIEKAHPDVFNILLQLLDEGMLTDSLGRKVDFKNTVIIMTSNIGARELDSFGRGIGFGPDKEGDEQKQSILRKALKKAFTPEFLNRIDDVVIFKSLGKSEIAKIVDIELDKFVKRVAENKYFISFDKNIRELIAEKGLDPKYGARPIKRAIQRYIEDEIANVIIEDNVPQNAELYVTFDKKKNKVNVAVKIKDDKTKE